MNSTICALIVTYNRCEYLAKLLNALDSQTHPISEIVIFDNCSTDETQDLLLKRGLIDHALKNGTSTIRHVRDVRFHCVRNEYNSGGSGGFHDGLKYASNLACDYIWMMDDDVLDRLHHRNRMVVEMAGGESRGPRCGWRGVRPAHPWRSFCR